MFRSLISLGALAASLVQATQPNILFVLTDDQDIELGSLNYLDSVTSLIQDEGKSLTVYSPGHSVVIWAPIHLLT